MSAAVSNPSISGICTSSRTRAKSWSSMSQGLPGGIGSDDIQVRTFQDALQGEQIFGPIIDDEDIETVRHDMSLIKRLRRTGCPRCGQYGPPGSLSRAAWAWSGSWPSRRLHHGHAAQTFDAGQALGAIVIGPVRMTPISAGPKASPPIRRGRRSTGGKKLTRSPAHRDRDSSASARRW